MGAVIKMALWIPLDNERPHRGCQGHRLSSCQGSCLCSVFKDLLRTWQVGALEAHLDNLEPVASRNNFFDKMSIE